jgi:hypothetical protein
VSRARVGSFSQPSLAFGAPLSVIHPPDNAFETVANTADAAVLTPEQAFAKATSGTLANEVAALYAALREAQELAK